MIEFRIQEFTTGVQPKKQEPIDMVEVMAKLSQALDKEKFYGTINMNFEAGKLTYLTLNQRFTVGELTKSLGI